MDSLFNTCNKVCELSKIFIYALSVSDRVRSYSCLVANFLFKLSFTWWRRSVSSAISFWSCAFCSSSLAISWLIISRFSFSSSKWVTSWLLKFYKEAPCDAILNIAIWNLSLYVFQYKKVLLNSKMGCNCATMSPAPSSSRRSPSTAPGSSSGTKVILLGGQTVGKTSIIT